MVEMAKIMKDEFQIQLLKMDSIDWKLCKKGVQLLPI